MSIATVSRRIKFRWSHIVIIAVVMIVAALIQLFLSMGTADSAYKINSLQAQNSAVTRQIQSVNETLSALQSPQNLAGKAQALGMQPSSTVTYISQNTGQVLGTAQPDGSKVTVQAAPVSNQVLSNLNQGSGSATQAQTNPQTTTPQLAQGAQNTADPGSIGVSSSDSNSQVGNQLPQATLR